MALSESGNVALNRPRASSDGVDPAPAFSVGRGAGDPPARERQRASPADPARQADRAARAGYQAHADLGQPERRVLGGDDASCESGQVDAGTDAAAVYAHG